MHCSLIMICLVQRYTNEDLFQCTAICSLFALFRYSEAHWTTPLVVRPTYRHPRNRGPKPYNICKTVIFVLPYDFLNLTLKYRGNLFLQNFTLNKSLLTVKNKILKKNSYTVSHWPLAMAEMWRQPVLFWLLYTGTCQKTLGPECLEHHVTDIPLFRLTTCRVRFVHYKTRCLDGPLALRSQSRTNERLE